MHIDPASPRPLCADNSPEFAPHIRAHREYRLSLFLLLYESLGRGRQGRGQRRLREYAEETGEPGILEG